MTDGIGSYPEAGIQGRNRQAPVRTDDRKVQKRGGDFSGDDGKVNPEMPDVTGGSVAMPFELVYLRSMAARVN